MDNVSGILLGLIVIVIIIAAVLIYVGSRVPDKEQDPLDARLAEFSQRGESISLEQIEMSQTFQ